MTVINETTAFCNQCNIDHPARIAREDNKLYAELLCPKKSQYFHLSNDADLYLSLRQNSHVDISEDIDESAFGVINFINVTNACNYNCPVCGVAPNNHAKNIHLPVGKIVQRCRQIKLKGGRNITLFGGEPTVHPDIIDIISCPTKKIKEC